MGQDQSGSVVRAVRPAQPDSLFGKQAVLDTRLQEEAQTLALATQMGRCPKDMRDWAEGLGYLALKSRIDSGAAIAAQAATTLTLLLAGTGAALAAGLPVLQPLAGPVAWGAAAVAAYLVLLVAATVRWCINLADAPPMYNRPGNLVIEGATLEQVRLGELASVDRRIRQQTALNTRRANALNRIRLAAIGAAPVFCAAAAAAVHWR